MDLTQTQRIHLRTLSKNLAPHLRIGKNGLSEGMKKELIAIYSKKGLIKIKLLPAALEQAPKETYFASILTLTQGIHIHTLGLTVTVYKPGFALSKLRGNIYKSEM